MVSYSFFLKEYRLRLLNILIDCCVIDPLLLLASILTVVGAGGEAAKVLGASRVHWSHALS